MKNGKIANPPSSYKTNHFFSYFLRTCLTSCNPVAAIIWKWGVAPFLLLLLFDLLWLGLYIIQNWITYWSHWTRAQTLVGPEGSSFTVWCRLQISLLVLHVYVCIPQKAQHKQKLQGSLADANIITLFWGSRWTREDWFPLLCTSLLEYTAKQSGQRHLLLCTVCGWWLFCVTELFCCDVVYLYFVLRSLIKEAFISMRLPD